MTGLVAGVTFLATLTIPLDRAVLLGTLVSLVAYLYRTSHPAIRPLVPDPRTPERRFTPLDELGQPAQECPQLKLVRVEGSVFFGAVPHVGDQLDGFRRAQPGQKHALFMTKSMNFIDLAGNDLWRREWRERRAQGGDLYFHRPRTPVLQLFAKTGFLKGAGRWPRLLVQGSGPAQHLSAAGPGGLPHLHRAHLRRMRGARGGAGARRGRHPDGLLSWRFPSAAGDFHDRCPASRSPPRPDRPAVARPGTGPGHLKSAEPAPDSTSAAPKQLSLSFSEGIEASLSQVLLQRQDGQASTAITTGKVISGRDERTLDVPLDAPLEPGRYQVKWRVLAKDGHKTQGDYRFTVQ